MNLYKLAFTSHIYDLFTSFNQTYKDLQTTTGASIDLSKETHRKALIVWLNKWGCRQFALDHHEEASRELLAWQQAGYIDSLSSTKKLWELNEKELDQVGVIYDTLVCRVASRPIKGDRAIPRTFGPTGASKILFALRPDLAAPWDSYIRKGLDYSGSGSSYVKYLKRLIREIEDLNKSCLENEYHLNEVPQIIKREGATIPQMVGEYFWVTETKKCYPPDNEVIQDWAKWSKKSWEIKASK